MILVQLLKHCSITLSTFSFVADLILLANGILILALFKSLRARSLIMTRWQLHPFILLLVLQSLSLMFHQNVGYLSVEAMKAPPSSSVVEQLQFKGIDFMLLYKASLECTSSDIFSYNPDYLPLILRCFILFVFSVYLLLVKNLLSFQKNNLLSEYSLVLLLSILGILVTTGSTELLLIFLVIEFQSLSMYLLAAGKKRSLNSMETGLKYFVLGSYSSGFFLYATGMLYASLGSLHLTEISYLLSDLRAEYFEYSTLYSWTYRNVLNTISAKDAITCIIVVLIIVTFMFKLGLAPTHSWAVDVFEKSPSVSTIFFSLISKIGMFALFLRLSFFTFEKIFEVLTPVIVFIGILTVIFGSLGGLKQRGLKSSYAYSSMSHYGLIFLLFCSLEYFSMETGISYVFLYTFSGLTAWTSFLDNTELKTISYKKRTNKSVGSLSMLFKANKVSAFLLTITLFSIAGLPPFSGFLAKAMVLFTMATQAILCFLSIIVIFVTVISTFYYIRLIKIIYFEQKISGELFYSVLSNKRNVVMTFAFFALVGLFLNPLNLVTTEPNDDRVSSLLSHFDLFVKWSRIKNDSYALYFQEKNALDVNDSFKLSMIRSWYKYSFVLFAESLLKDCEYDFSQWCFKLDSFLSREMGKYGGLPYDPSPPTDDITNMDLDEYSPNQIFCKNVWVLGWKYPYEIIDLLKSFQEDLRSSKIWEVYANRLPEGPVADRGKHFFEAFCPLTDLSVLENTVALLESLEKALNECSEKPESCSSSCRKPFEYLYRSVAVEVADLIFEELRLRHDKKSMLILGLTESMFAEDCLYSKGSPPECTHYHLGMSKFMCINKHYLQFQQIINKVESSKMYQSFLDESSIKVFQLIEHWEAKDAFNVILLSDLFIESDKLVQGYMDFIQKGLSPPRPSATLGITPSQKIFAANNPVELFEALGGDSKLWRDSMEKLLEDLISELEPLIDRTHQKDVKEGIVKKIVFLKDLKDELKFFLANHEVTKCSDCKTCE